MNNEILTPTMEDYLEAILLLEEEKKAVRVKDIAKNMDVKLPTVTSMLNTLMQRGLINHEKYEYVELTDKGLDLAKEVKRKHELLSSFLSNILGIDLKRAEEDACKMEHAVSPETMERLVEFMEFIEVCPRSGPSWLKSFATYCAKGTEGHSPQECLRHMREFVKEFDFKLKEMETRKEAQPIEKSLMELSPGQKGRIAKVKGTDQIHQRILDMGVVPGAIVEMEYIAPLGDPVEVKLKGYHLSLRKEEASNVYIEEV
ncbi:MAG: metal-dependent transcriptional regulator [Deltaproteobacteria bacterium]|nr:metal-dependent transcriptional regulator [Deltaproteobacteria bacterium]